MNPPPQTILKNNIPSKFKKHLQQAIDEQQRIGWASAFRGFLSYNWLTAQQLEHPNSSITGLRRQWLKPVIKAIWKVSLSQWETRNGILHSNQAQPQTIRDSSIDAKVRTAYFYQDTFAASDQVLFNIPVELRLQKSSRDKRHWLSLVAHYHPTTIARHQGNQPRITQFFSSVTSNNSTKQIDKNTSSQSTNQPS
jgi:hypothetical protein